MKRAATLVLFLLAAACATVQRPAEPVHVVIVSTTDLHGWFAGHNDKVPYGGLPLFASYVAALRAANPDHVLLVDSGDLFQGTLESNLFEGDPVVRGYNALGYTAAAVGNHEFDYGPVGPHPVAVDPGEDPLGALEKNAANAKFSFLAANITEKATGRSPSWLKPSMIVDAGGAKVGIVGLATPDTPNTTIASNVQSLNFGDPVEATVREARALRAAGADAVIVIAHIGGHCADTSNPQDPSSCERDQDAMRFLAAVPAGTVDAYFGGHTHSDMRHFVSGIPASEAGAYSREFGTMDLYVDAQKHAVVADRTTIRPLTMICASVFAGTQTCDPKKAPAGAALVPATFEGRPVAPVAEVASLLDPYMKQVAAKRNEPTGISTTAAFTRKYRLESALGDLLTDAFREWAHTDVAILNSGGIRSNLHAGNLVYSDIFEVMPFDNVPAIVTMTGAQLTEMIRLMTIPGRGIAQVSGVHYTFDESRAGAERLVSVTLPNGREVDPNAMYRVALPDFIVTGGEGMGSLMAAIPANQKKIDQTITLRDVLIAALKNRPMPLQPSTDGRITVLNPPPPSEER